MCKRRMNKNMLRGVYSRKGGRMTTTHLSLFVPDPVLTHGHTSPDVLLCLPAVGHVYSHGTGVCTDVCDQDHNCPMTYLRKVLISLDSSQ